MNEYFASIAEVSPRAAILEAWIGFEITATSCAKRLELVPADKPVQMPALLRALRHGGLVTKEEAEALTKLRALRNEVVHAAYLNLSKEKAAEYAALVREIAEAIAARTHVKAPSRS